MMRRMVSFFVRVSLFAALIFATVVAYALPAGTISPTTTVKTAGTAPPPPDPLADLVVTDISVDAECRVVAHLANIGGAPLSSTITELQVSFSGVVNGGYKFPADKLRAPGATTTYSIPTPKVVGSQAQKVSLTPVGIIPEPSKDNNYRSETLTCSPKFADFAIAVTVKPDCSRSIEVSNIGEAGLYPYAWNLAITRNIDGLQHTPIKLDAIDSGHALATPAGKAVYNEPLAGLRAYDKATYTLSYPYQEKGDNKANNTTTVTMPAACRGVRPPVDVAISNLRLDANCRVLATLKNTGTNPLPFLWLTTTFTKNGVGVGGWNVDTTPASAVGAETTVYGPAAKDTTAATFKVVLDGSNRLVESREDNNTASSSLLCGAVKLQTVPKVIGGSVLGGEVKQ